MANYARLSPDQTQVIGFSDINPAQYDAWVSNGNPKADSYRVVNLTAQPAFDAATQAVQQNGWLITATDVQPNWQVVTLSATDQTTYQNTQNRLSLINTALNNLQNADNNWGTLTLAQKDQVQRYLVKINIVLLNQQARLLAYPG
jgi:UV DNA damage repair endonuclease